MLSSHQLAPKRRRIASMRRKKMEAARTQFRRTTLHSWRANTIDQIGFIWPGFFRTQQPFYFTRYTAFDTASSGHRRSSDLSRPTSWLPPWNFQTDPAAHPSSLDSERSRCCSLSSPKTRGSPCRQVPHRGDVHAAASTSPPRTRTGTVDRVGASSTWHKLTIYGQIQSKTSGSVLAKEPAINSGTKARHSGRLNMNAPQGTAPRSSVPKPFCA